MSTEKLSELSKPTALRNKYTGRTFNATENMEPQIYESLYSQEYVSALLADNEALKIRAGQQQSVAANNLEMFRKADERAETLLAELERYKQYAKERDAENESLALTVGRLRVELEAKDKCIAELEAEITNIVDSHAETVAELRAKLATPVRLPGSFYPDGDIDCPLVVELDEAVEAIRAAGFVVEGSEQDG